MLSHLLSRIKRFFKLKQDENKIYLLKIPNNIHEKYIGYPHLLEHFFIRKIFEDYPQNYKRTALTSRKNIIFNIPYFSSNKFEILLNRGPLNIIADKEIVESEKLRIIEERNFYEKNSSSELVDEMYKNFKDFSKFPIEGYKESIKNFSLKDLKVFYQQYFNRNNSLIKIYPDKENKKKIYQTLFPNVIEEPMNKTKNIFTREKAESSIVSSIKHENILNESFNYKCKKFEKSVKMIFLDYCLKDYLLKNKVPFDAHLFYQNNGDKLVKGILITENYNGVNKKKYLKEICRNIGENYLKKMKNNFAKNYCVEDNFYWLSNLSEILVYFYPKEVQNIYLKNIKKNVIMKLLSQLDNNEIRNDFIKMCSRYYYYSKN